VITYLQEHEDKHHYVGTSVLKSIA